MIIMIIIIVVTTVVNGKRALQRPVKKRNETKTIIKSVDVSRAEVTRVLPRGRRIETRNAKRIKRRGPPGQRAPRRINPLNGPRVHYNTRATGRRRT